MLSGYLPAKGGNKLLMFLKTGGGRKSEPNEPVSILQLIVYYFSYVVFFFSLDNCSYLCMIVNETPWLALKPNYVFDGRIWIVI